MMRSIRSLLEKYEFHPTRYQMKGKVTFIDTDRGKFAIKEMEHDKEEIWNYLRSRNFLYYPEIIGKENQKKIFICQENKKPLISLI